jgi:hypothetical protein
VRGKGCRGRTCVACVVVGVLFCLTESDTVGISGKICLRFFSYDPPNVWVHVHLLTDILLDLFKTLIGCKTKICPFQLARNIRMCAAVLW